jgi:hypothetical protein
MRFLFREIGCGIGYFVKQALGLGLCFRRRLFYSFCFRIIRIELLILAAGIGDRIRGNKKITSSAILRSEHIFVVINRMPQNTTRYKIRPTLERTITEAASYFALKSEYTRPIRMPRHEPKKVVNIIEWPAMLLWNASGNKIMGRKNVPKYARSNLFFI